MKKFRWRLQRLLDVRGKQEDALRAELMGLTEQIAALRGRILMEKTVLRTRLIDLRQTAAEKRIVCQQSFMDCVAVVDDRIAGFQDDLNILEQNRKEKTEAIMAIRKFRKALEQLRAKALDDYTSELNSETQKHQDENVNNVFTRKMIEASQ